MFFSFVDELRAAGIPASMKEHLTLLEALDADVIGARPEDFYYLARATFVKDEGLLDRFDQVFGKVFKGLEAQYGPDAAPVPEEWLKAVAALYLTPEQMAEIGRFAREMTEAGVLVMTGGLVRPNQGTKVRLAAGKFSVTDGPYAETKELIDGFAVIDVKSKQEAFEMAERFMRIAGDGEGEILQMFGPEDGPPPR